MHRRIHVTVRLFRGGSPEERAEVLQFEGTQPVLHIHLPHMPAGRYHIVVRCASGADWATEEKGALH